MRVAPLVLIVLAGCPPAQAPRSGAPAMVIARAPGCPVRVAACENRVEYGSGDTRLTGVFGYNEAGQITSYCETAADGSVRFDLTRSYDERGRRIQQIEDVANLGPAHRVATWAYDSTDRLRHITVDFDGDVRVTERQYGFDGRLARSITTGADRPADVVTYRYRDGDSLVVDEDHDSNGDDQIDWTWRYTFVAGRWLARVDRVEGDGAVRPIEWYTYVDVELGRLARRDFDSDGDGTSDDITAYTWHDGRVATTTYDQDADGRIDQQYDYAYDRAGRMTRRRWSIAADAHASMTTFAWDASALDRVEHRDAATGDVIGGWTFERGCPGDPPMTLLLAPTSDWARELDPVGFTIDLRRFWGFFEVI